MERLFLELLKQRITEFITTCYDNKKRFVIWDKPYVYEDINKHDINLLIDIENVAEYRIYNVTKLLTQKCFQSFTKQYNCPIKIDRYVITIEPIIDKIEDIVEYISVKQWNNRMSVYLDGILFNYPSISLSVNFINSYEYVIHIYNKNDNGKLTMLYHCFKDYLQF